MTTRHYVPLSGSPDWAAGIVANRKLMLGEQRRSMGNASFQNDGSVGKVWVSGDEIVLIFNRLGSGEPALKDIIIGNHNVEFRKNYWLLKHKSLLYTVVSQLLEYKLYGYFGAISTALLLSDVLTDTNSPLYTIIHGNRLLYYSVQQSGDSYYKRYYDLTTSLCGPASSHLTPGYGEYYYYDYLTKGYPAITPVIDIRSYNIDGILGGPYVDIATGTIVEGYLDYTFTVPSCYVFDAYLASVVKTPYTDGPAGISFSGKGIQVVYGPDLCLLYNGNNVSTNQLTNSSEPSRNAIFYETRSTAEAVSMSSYLESTWQEDDGYGNMREVVGVTGMAFKVDPIFTQIQIGGGEISAWSYGTPYPYNLVAHPTGTAIYSLPYTQYLPAGGMLFGEQRHNWPFEWLCAVMQAGVDDSYCYFQPSSEAASFKLVDGKEALGRKADTLIKTLYRSVEGALELVII